MPETTTPIHVAFPEEPNLHLRLAVGACRLHLTPAEDAVWAAGEYVDPSGALPLHLSQEGGTLHITQTHTFEQLRGFWEGGPPRLDLALGRAQPYALTVESGASDNLLDLGGRPLTRLTLRLGAGRNEVDFSAPNPAELDLLTVGAGAAAMTLRRLANANFAEMSIEGGAAAYVFDFGGTLQRDAQVRAVTGMSSVELIVPAATAARVTVESVLGGVDVGDGFTKREGAFWTPGALAGAAPALTIRASVTLGSVKLRVA